MKQTRHEAARSQQKVKEGDALLSDYVDKFIVMCVDGVMGV